MWNSWQQTLRIIFNRFWPYVIKKLLLVNRSFVELQTLSDGNGQNGQTFSWMLKTS